MPLTLWMFGTQFLRCSILKRLQSPKNESMIRFMLPDPYVIRNESSLKNLVPPKNDTRNLILLIVYER